MSEKIKEFYESHPDKIIEKRFKSPHPVRRYVHEAQYQSILQYVTPGMKVLDAGCGEGVLSVLMAEKGAIVTGCDLSEPNIKKCNEYAKEMNVEVTFLLGDAEELPFKDDSFDLVVSSHVLEHLPDFDKGLRELLRVSKKRAVAAIPTVLNPCSWVQVGGGDFWLKGLRSFLALPWGFVKMIGAFVSGNEGVNEGYGGGDVPHIFRFPRVMKQKIARNGFTLVEYEASSLCKPFFVRLLPAIKKADTLRKKCFFRNLGYGTTFVIEKD